MGVVEQIYRDGVRNLPVLKLLVKLKTNWIFEEICMLGDGIFLMKLYLLSYQVTNR